MCFQYEVLIIFCSKEYERESQLSQEQYSQDMSHQASQEFSRPGSQEFSRAGPTRQGSVPGWNTTEVQQESVSLLANSQEIGWPVRNVRRTLPRPTDMQQESVSLLANSQELSCQEPRRTLPRPPTWPRIASAGRPSDGAGKRNSQEFGSRDAPDGSKGQRVARWRLPCSSNKENIWFWARFYSKYMMPWYIVCLNTLIKSNVISQYPRVNRYQQSNERLRSGYRLMYF